MMSGNSDYHEQLEAELAAFVMKEDAALLNFGYQGMVSIIDVLCSRHDVIVYDAESHACIIDGLRLHPVTVMYINIMTSPTWKNNCSAPRPWSTNRMRVVYS